VNVAEVLDALPDGPLEMLAVGATVSTVHDCEAAGPVFPTASLAFTEKVWLPWERAEYVLVPEQAVNAALSRLQVNVELPSDEV
jgi:hypothetical protein